MGGSGSSRWGGYVTRATTTSTMALAVGAFREALNTGGTERQAGTMQWRWDGRRQEMGLTISPAVVNPETGRTFRTCTFDFRVSTGSTGDNGQEVRLEVPFEGVPARFGGLRWWVVCPTCRHRRTALFLVPALGSWRFACRRCGGLAYPSQQESPEDRAYRRVVKLSRRMGVKVEAPADSFDVPLRPRRPKGMRRATYRALVPKWEEAVLTHSVLFSRSFERVLGRIGSRQQGAR